MVFLDHYYYGDYKLPELPEYDKGIYPYGFISESNDCYYFTAASKEGYFEQSVAGFIYTLGGTLTSNEELKFDTFSYILGKEGADLETESMLFPGVNTRNWAFIEMKSGVPAVSVNSGPIWVSTELKYKDGTLITHRTPHKIFSMEKFLLGIQLSLAGAQLEDIDLQRKYVGYFPEIPEYNKEEYPYIIATNSALNNVVVFYVSDSPFYLDKETNKICFLEDGNYMRCLVSLYRIVINWQKFVHTAGQELDTGKFKPIWSNDLIKYITNEGEEGIYQSFPTTPPSVY